MPAESVAFQPRAPGAGDRSAFFLLALTYVVAGMAVVPWATGPGLNEPQIVAVSNSAMLVAQLCTALLLAMWYRESGRTPLLALACGYLYGALMAALHMVAFPGALPTLPPVFASEQAVGWLYLTWRAGMAVFYLLAVVLEATGTAVTPVGRRHWLGGLVGLLVVAICAWLAAQADAIGVRWLAGDAFTSFNLGAVWGSVALLGAALLIITRKRAFDETLYLWLALVMVTAIVDLSLANFGGARYTVGWHASRASFVVSAYLLLAFLIAEISNRGRPVLAAVAAYGGALAATLAAVFLRWFLHPWLGPQVPFITLFGAVALSVWLGGMGPALVSAALGYVLIRLIYADVSGGPWIERPADAVQPVLYAVTNALIIGLGEGMRRARDRARISEQALRERAAELQRADANKSQFLAVLSHELRNPLAPLVNGLAILRQKPDSGAARRTLEMMERQVRNLTRLIDDLMDMSRIDRGKLAFRSERLALEAVARAAVETVMPEIESKSHQLSVQFAAQPLYVDGDAVRLTQALANLLNNAAKFTPHGGRIGLEVHTADGTAVITVTDTGIGIERANLDSVFDLFVQVSGARTEGAGGLGLGLTLVRSIVQRHGGNVQALSAGANLGSQFVITLPLASSPAPQAVAATGQPGAPTRKSRVLVVDDNADAANSLAALLRIDGHQVETALGGEDALRAAETLHPDIAFIDLNMPQMDGFELVRRLRAAPFGINTRLVAVTGMGQEMDVARTRQAGFVVHLTKPADPQRVLRLAAGGDGRDNVITLRGGNAA